MDRMLVLGLAVATAIAWFPFGWSFMRSWQKWRNPKSLAIAIAIGALAIGPVGIAFWLLVEGIRPLWVVEASVGLSLAVCLIFYLAFYLERRWYPKDPAQRRRR